MAKYTFHVPGHAEAETKEFFHTHDELHRAALWAIAERLEALVNVLQPVVDMLNEKATHD